MGQGQARSGLVFEEPLIFDRSVPGRRGDSLPRTGVPPVDPAGVLPEGHLRREDPALPEVSELDVVRHYTRLSGWNFGVDSGFYPLGSCTMKYNPRVNEKVARLPGFACLHPYQPEETVQGALALMYHLERYLAEISGFARVTMVPAAGAHGEFTGLMMVRAHHLRTEGRPRRKVLVPDTAHGTNPASSAFAGYEVVTLASSPEGHLDVATVHAALDGDVAAVMLTNPNTVGIFERDVGRIGEAAHARGALLYCDGANLNAVLGRSRPGDWGVDVMQFNLHKTFSTPHGGGGPGAGPVGVSPTLVPYLPVPVVERDPDGTFRLSTDRPQSIGRVKGFHGQFAVMVRAYAYLRELGAEGLPLVSGLAVLNARYLRERLRGAFDLPFPAPCLHEFVLSDRRQQAAGIKTLDIAKRLIDYGFHPPTIYFPLVVHGALMIEPTETESRETLDAFADAMLSIAARVARGEKDDVLAAPTLPVCRRLDEASAARHPVLRHQS